MKPLFLLLLSVLSLDAAIVTREASYQVFLRDFDVSPDLLILPFSVRVTFDDEAPYEAGRFALTNDPDLFQPTIDMFYRGQYSRAQVSGYRQVLSAPDEPLLESFQLQSPNLFLNTILGDVAQASPGSRIDVAFTISETGSGGELTATEVFLRKRTPGGGFLFRPDRTFWDLDQYDVPLPIPEGSVLGLLLAGVGTIVLVRRARR